MTENAPPTQNGERSLLALALRVLKGELTEAEFLEIVKGQPEDKAANE